MIWKYFTITNLDGQIQRQEKSDMSTYEAVMQLHTHSSQMRKYKKQTQEKLLIETKHNKWKKQNKSN